MRTRNGHARTWSWQVALALTALPVIVLAPALSGVLLVHDHGSHGIHVHRTPHHASARPTGLIAALSRHHHDHRHDHAGSPEHPAPRPPEESDVDGLVILFPRTRIAPLPSAALPCLAAPRPLGFVVSIEPAGPPSRTASDRRADRAPPTRSGAGAILLSSHALLI